MNPVIIGGGIAGASVARAFLREGVVPVVIRAPDHAQTAASANPKALVKPRLDRQDRPESRFFLQAYLFALQAYGAGEKGVIQIAKSDDMSERYADLLEQQPLPPTHMDGHPRGLRFPQSLVIDPVLQTQDFLDGADVIDACAESWRATPDGWHVMADGKVVASGSHLILASGLHLKTALPGLALRASRGQLSWAKTEVAVPLAYGGYALPCDGRTLLGATHDRVANDPYRLDPEDDIRNAHTLEQTTGIMASELAPARASVRVNSANTLPVLREIEPGCWALTALGSRGFTHAPLLGAQVVSRILGLPEPLTAEQTAKFERGS